MWFRILTAVLLLSFLSCTEDGPGKDIVLDSDGDGLSDSREADMGSDPSNPCSPERTTTYTGFDPENAIWAAADCDGDGNSNGSEVAQGSNPYQDERIDSDGDGLTDLEESESGTDPEDPCDPQQGGSYTGYDAQSESWNLADCDADGMPNGAELEAGRNPYADETADKDGDGIPDMIEVADGSDPEDPCDPQQDTDYTGYNPINELWAAADCDSDGQPNGAELTAGLNPYADDVTDTDGDGYSDYLESQQDSDPENPCDPLADPGYEGYDPENTIWGISDCDTDGLSNSDELEAGLDPYMDERVFASATFTPTLSQMNVFEGPISDLQPGRTAFSYSLNTPLFTDYAHKLRTISLPKDGRMRLVGNGLLEFPDQTVITKTFFYYLDERNQGIGKRIIETRVLIKNNGIWEVGNYLWNDQQSEAVLDGNRHILSVSWTDASGAPRSAGYTVPSTNDCISCHSKNGAIRPIGPKARALYNLSNGPDQLLQWSGDGLLEEVVALGGIDPLPDARDVSYALEARARAYLDVNCAHCHQPGSLSYSGSLDLRFETPFAQTAIESLAADIQFRMTTSISSLKMPQIGTSIPHDEGIDLINAYIDSLN